MQKIFDLDLSGKTSYVYFLRVGESGPIKIGFTKRIRYRLVTVQVDNPCLVWLLAVFPGGRKEEFELHKKFAKYRLYGEWFDPNEELLAFINQYPSLNLVSSDFQKPTKRGAECPNWKGELAGRCSKQQRARAYKRYKKSCERCGLRKGLDTVFLDGNKDNLIPENLALYCRRCRMEVDGTLANLIATPKRQPSTRDCKICGRATNRLWYDRCHACNEFWRRNGFERSEKQKKLPAEPAPCINCGKVAKLEKNKCHACYEFFRHHAYDRTFDNDTITEDVLLLNTLESGIEKAKLLRKLYSTQKYSAQFLAKHSNMSTSFFNDIVRNKCFVDNEYVFVRKRRKKAENHIQDA